MEVAKFVCEAGSCVITQAGETFCVLDANAQEVGRGPDIESAVYCARLIGDAL